ncbi:hypothetical protein HHX47_DHR2000335 [Lentinula edodes]|nr:hypothetical protein HHX47_DHR2000335 [Lentinula edodes]
MSLDETQSSPEPSKPPDLQRTPRGNRILPTGRTHGRTPLPIDPIRPASSRRTSSGIHAPKPYERQHLQSIRKISDLTQMKHVQRNPTRKPELANHTVMTSNGRETQSDAEADISDMDSDMDVEPPANQIIELIELLSYKIQEAIQSCVLPSNFAEQVSDQGHMLTEMLKGVGVGLTGSEGSGVERILMSQLSAIHESIAADKEANEKRLERIEKALSNPSGRKTAQTSSAPNWADDSYAAQAARPALKPPSKTRTTSPPAPISKRDAERETRFVAYFNGSVEPKDRKEPHEIVRRVNDDIKELFPKCSNTKVATAKWNASGNLVLSVLPGQKAKALEEIFDLLHTAYTKTDAIPQDTRLDIEWNKIIVDGVPTGSTWSNQGGLGRRPHKSEELATEAKTYNPLLADKAFALAPRFLVPPADLVGKAESSIVFAIHDKETANDIISLGYIVIATSATDLATSVNAALTSDAVAFVCTVCRDDASVKEADFTLDSLTEGSIPMCMHKLKQCPERTRQMGSVRDNNRATGAGNVASPSYARKKKKTTKGLAKAPSQPASLTVSNSFAAIDPAVTDGIRFAQLNANKKKSPIVAMLNARIDEFDIIFIEEPNWSFIGKEGDDVILGAVNHASAWTPISPIPAAPDSIHPRVYAYVKNGLHAEVTLRTDIICDRDIMVLDVTPQGGRTTTYIHFYNDPSMGRQQILWRLRHLGLPLDRPVVLTGDANIHHIRWSRGAPRTSSITEEVVAWLDEHNFLLVNKKGVPTHFPHDTEKHPSVIDLTWSNVQATRNDAIRDWAIDDNLAVGSDHMGIRWALNQVSEGIENPMGVKYNMKEVKPKDWIEAFNEEVSCRSDKLYKLLDEELKLTQHELDTALE